MIWLLVVVLAVLAPLLYFYVKVKQKQSYWEKRGVPYIKPTFPFGAVQLIRSKSVAEQLKDIYDAFPDQRYHGVYIFMDPILVIKDPDLIKTITVKEFDHFLDHRTVVSNDIDPIWGKNLINSSGERWRSLRATLSPSFTGSKMRIMYTLMDECAQQFIDHFRSHQSEIIDVEVKDALSRYTNDVIATTAFGLKCDSLKDRNNQFYLMGKDVTNLSGLKLIRYFLYNISPTLMKLFGIKVIPPTIAEFFSNIIRDTVKTRQEQTITRADMIHLLMEAQKESTKAITIDDIIAQAFIFFFAGFDTISTLLSFAFYELALQPDLQDRLRRELNLVEGELTYEKLQSLKYLDMVVSETLRKWTPSILTDRKVTKEFTIEPERPGEKPLLLEKGVICLMPLWAYHRDPKLYPEPEKFDPERFSDENKQNLKPQTFIPFGAGPRMCIGNRFALLENEALTCNVCDRSFACPKQLSSHKQKKRHFGCSACDSLFPSLMALEHHKEEFEHWSGDEDDICTDSDDDDETVISEECERLL